MSRFSPTFGAWETTKNVFSYIKNNFGALWEVLSVYIPYLVVASFVSNFITDILPSDSWFFIILPYIAFIPITWFTFCFIVSWHRVVIHGANTEIIHPLRANKTVFLFLGIATVLAAIPILSGLLLAAAVWLGFNMIGIAGAAVIAVISIVLFFDVLYITTLCAAALPSIAAGARLSLKEAYHLMKGYFLKIAGTGFLNFLVLAIPYTIMSLAYIIVIGGVMIFMQGNVTASAAITSLFMLPFDVIIIPILYAIGATTLSNFYMHALANKKD